MAHECPDCGCRCHCGGDIDDIVFRDTRAEATCCHCGSQWNNESDDEEDFYDDDDFDEEYF